MASLKAALAREALLRRTGYVSAPVHDVPSASCSSRSLIGNVARSQNVRVLASPLPLSVDVSSRITPLKLRRSIQVEVPLNAPWRSPGPARRDLFQVEVPLNAPWRSPGPARRDLFSYTPPQSGSTTPAMPSRIVMNEAALEIGESTNIGLTSMYQISSASASCRRSPLPPGRSIGGKTRWQPVRDGFGSLRARVTRVACASPNSAYDMGDKQESSNSPHLKNAALDKEAQMLFELASAVCDIEGIQLDSNSHQTDS